MLRKIAAGVLLATVIMTVGSHASAQLEGPIFCMDGPGCFGWDVCEENAAHLWACSEIYCGRYVMREVNGELVWVFEADFKMRCCSLVGGRGEHCFPWLQ